MAGNLIEGGVVCVPDNDHCCCHHILIMLSKIHIINVIVLLVNGYVVVRVWLCNVIVSLMLKIRLNGDCFKNILYVCIYYVQYVFV